MAVKLPTARALAFRRLASARRMLIAATGPLCASRLVSSAMRLYHGMGFLSGSSWKYTLLAVGFLALSTLLTLSSTTMRPALGHELFTPVVGCGLPPLLVALGLARHERAV